MGEWTQENILLLTELWECGKTAQYITDRLEGFTRNAVIGKAHRLKLTKRPSPIICNPAKQEKKMTDEIKAYCKAVRSMVCLWPDECNEPIHKKSYCEKHYKIAYMQKEKTA